MVKTTGELLLPLPKIKHRGSTLLVSGRVDDELLLRNEYLAAENEILKSKLNKPLQLDNYERIRLAKIGKRIGLKALREISCIVRAETILEWFRRLVAKKFDGSMFRKPVGRPKTDHVLESLIIQFAEENSLVYRCRDIFNVLFHYSSASR